MDDRTYIRLHDGMPDHPKVVGLSDKAFRLFVESMCWCSRYLTDGAVRVAAMRRMNGWSPAALKELAEAGLLEDGVAPDWDVHDYTEHQRTAAEVEEFRKMKRTAAVVGNHERWHVSRNLIDPGCDLCVIADASHVRSQTDDRSIVGSESECDRKSSPETETETEGKKKRLAQVGSDDDPDFTAWWSAYPRKIGKGQARKAYRGAVIGRHVEPKDLRIAAERYADDVHAKRTDPQYIPYPATWLNGERWGDIEAAAPAVRSNSPYEN